MKNEPLFQSWVFITHPFCFEKIKFVTQAERKGYLYHFCIKSQISWISLNYDVHISPIIRYSRFPTLLPREWGEMTIYWDKLNYDGETAWIYRKQRLRENKKSLTCKVALTPMCLLKIGDRYPIQFWRTFETSGGRGKK